MCCKAERRMKLLVHLNGWSWLRKKSLLSNPKSFWILVFVTQRTPEIWRKILALFWTIFEQATSFNERFTWIESFKPLRFTSAECLSKLRPNFSASVSSGRTSLVLCPHLSLALFVDPSWCFAAYEYVCWKKREGWSTIALLGSQSPSLRFGPHWRSLANFRGFPISSRWEIRGRSPKSQYARCGRLGWKIGVAYWP